MARLEVTATAPVPVPADQAWELICDTSSYAEWVAGTDEVTRTDGPAAVGSTYDEVNPVLGPWKARSHWTVTEHEPPRRTVHRAEKLSVAAWFEVVMTIAPVGDDACEVTTTLTAESRYGPAGALMTRLLKGQIESDNRKTAEGFAAFAAREAGVPA
jgi:hypothetical protein